MEKLSLNEQMKIPCHSYANVNIMTTFHNIMSNTDDQYTVTYIHLKAGQGHFYILIDISKSHNLQENIFQLNVQEPKTFYFSTHFFSISFTFDY